MHSLIWHLAIKTSVICQMQTLSDLDNAETNESQFNEVCNANIQKLFVDIKQSIDCYYD